MPLFFRFRTTAPVNITYSYKPQVDECPDDDVLTLPHQSSGSVKSNSIPTSVSLNYDSTQFASTNPLYITSSSMGSSIQADLSITREYFADESA